MSAQSGRPVLGNMLQCGMMVAELPTNPKQIKPIRFTDCFTSFTYMCRHVKILLVLINLSHASFCCVLALKLVGLNSMSCKVSAKSLSELRKSLGPLRRNPADGHDVPQTLPRRAKVSNAFAAKR